MRAATKEKRETVVYRRKAGTPLTAAQIANLNELSNLPDSAIDTSDIPELPEDVWKNAMRGELYRPRKKAVSLRLDADVIEWLKKDGGGYQTRANKLLRERMLAESKRR
jgi:uncharacterized protein (DUF4415 family)